VPENDRRTLHQLQSELDDLKRELSEIQSGRVAATRVPPVREALISPQEQAEQMRLVGLSLSGGGIRSATFNLGVVQALADGDLLRQVDYLSAVSGGSYIASWLAAWAKRQTDGILRVQRWLSPFRSPNPDAEEVRPIRFLRRYSNYLAPRKGLFSADTLTMFTVWLRNTVLNQLVIVLLLAAILLVPRLLYVWMRIQPGVHWLPLSGILLVLVSVLIGVHLSQFENGNLGPRDTRIEHRFGQSYVQWFIVLPLVAIAFAVARSMYWIGAHSQDPGNLFVGTFQLVWGTGVVLFVGIFAANISGRLARCFFLHDQNPSKARLVIASMMLTLTAAACAVIGAELVYAAIQILDFDLPVRAGRMLVFGVPCILVAFGIVAMAEIGLLGINFPDERREWWARLAAWVTIYISGIIAVMAFSIYAPWWMSQLTTKHKTIAAAIWSGWTALGTIVGKSGATPAKGDTSGGIRWLNLLATSAPTVFVAGLLVLISWTTNYFLLWQSGHLNLASPANVGDYWRMIEIPWQLTAQWLLIASAAALFLGWRIDVNDFSMHHFYRNRLMRCYLGATREWKNRHPNPFTGFDSTDDLKMAHLTVEHAPDTGGELHPYVGPYLIVNTALNLVSGKELAWQERKAESFSFTPLFCGYEYLDPDEPAMNAGLMPDDTVQDTIWTNVGYRPTNMYAYPKGGVGLATTVGISGAAANPNMGYHSSRALAFLMTLFNARLGWWIGNTRHDSMWRRWSPPLGLVYLLSELTGNSSDQSPFVNLSDGGHFENLGIYELVRRRCKFIVACDAEEDGQFTFGGLGNVVRKCRTDFGVDIVLDIEKIRTVKISNEHKAHWVIGDVIYPNGFRGELLYIKSSLTGDEPVDVREYSWRAVKFPHQSTADQFFNESQFESYRALGWHIMRSIPAFIDADDFQDLFRSAKTNSGQSTVAPTSPTSA
jgi:hypothetical protein